MNACPVRWWRVTHRAALERHQIREAGWVPAYEHQPRHLFLSQSPSQAKETRVQALNCQSEPFNTMRVLIKYHPPGEIWMESLEARCRFLAFVHSTRARSVSSYSPLRSHSLLPWQARDKCSTGS